MYKPVNPELNFTKYEEEVLKYWQDNNIFKQVLNKSGNYYAVYDGPPTVNGFPHAGHAKTRVFKDLFPRYHTMLGQSVLRKTGWDTHGLPVELEIEKLLNLHNKNDIEQYGIEKFIKQCKSSIHKYKNLWEQFSNKLGYWFDNEHPYITCDNNYIESVWWALAQIHNKGLLYQGYKIVPYCPRCETALSSHEVAQGYKNISTKSLYIKFKIDDKYLLVWTTTPWTLPANVALCVNESIQYSLIHSLDDNNDYYIAADLISTLFNNYKIIDTISGYELTEFKYQSLFDNQLKPIVSDNYVSTNEGTGIVHLAPAFGEDDYRVCQKYSLPFINNVNSQGMLSYKNKLIPINEANYMIINDLHNQIFKIKEIEHNYPHCWRCDTPLIYYAQKSWFVKTTEMKEQLLKNNKSINWLPENIGSGRFKNWLENIQDWNISRNRYWGTPLNIWKCDCGHIHVIESIEELSKLTGCPQNIELHKPYIDDLTIKCSECGSLMYRVPEVLDCWFDSGCMPFAQWHYPFENQTKFTNYFPADFISEAIDQTRGWFYSLLAVSTILFNKAPFKNCMVLGLILDEDGIKMSKSKGNAIDPIDVLNQFGADSLRWYFYKNSSPAQPNRFYDKAINECQRKFLGTLWNIYSFFVLYANIDKIDMSKYSLNYDTLNLIDKWIYSQLNFTIKNIRYALDHYQVNDAVDILEIFIDNVSNWYIRLNRKRYWSSEIDQSKINAYLILYTILKEMSKTIAPMLPFISETIYQNLKFENDPQSVHLCSYPDCNYIDEELEQQVNDMIDIVTFGRTLRNDAKIKIRQPLSTLYINKELNQELIDLIKSELNIKTVSVINNMQQFMTYDVKLNFKVVGKKYKSKINELKDNLSKINGILIKESLEQLGQFTLNGCILLDEDLIIKSIPNKDYKIIDKNGLTVILDTSLNQQLINEGYIREFISKIQNLRKTNKFEVTDKIKIFFNGPNELVELIFMNTDIIQNLTLANEITLDKTINNRLDINGLYVNLKLELA